ncbi:MAG: flagellar motor protein MotB, partial [Bryobacteraceae bacterium]
MNMASAGRIRPRHYQTPASGHDRWMISYMDIVTILLILFVALAAQSLQHPQKTAAAAPVAAPVKAMSQPLPPAPVPQSRSVLFETQEKLREHGLESRLEPRGLVISLP